MIITQPTLRMLTIKATLKCAVVLGFFFLLFGGGGPQPFTSCSATTAYTVMVGQGFDCGLWNVGRLLFSGCARLPDIGRNWNTLSSRLIYSIAKMLSGWRPVSLLAIQELGHFRFQELFAYPCNMGPCIMLQPELMWWMTGLRIWSE